MCKVHILNDNNKYTCGNFTIEIKPISTVFYGICYSMQVMENITADEFLIIKFLKSDSGKVIFITHNKCLIICLLSLSVNNGNFEKKIKSLSKNFLGIFATNI